eukprot:COSAG01_NODE_65249_length_274_cov_0.314286_1_plen_76_part_01
MHALTTQSTQVNHDFSEPHLSRRRKGPQCARDGCVAWYAVSILNFVINHRRDIGKSQSTGTDRSIFNFVIRTGVT